MRGAPTELIVVCALAGTLCAAVLPTCLYLYVEPRARVHWARSDALGSQRGAPSFVRGMAWVSFFLAQLAVPWLLVPLGCAILFYLQCKLGALRPVGGLLTAGLGTLALAQGWVALRLFPLGVRWLAGDPKAFARVRARGLVHAGAHALAFVCLVALDRGLADPSPLVHPWLWVALRWTAVRPIEAASVIAMVHSLLLLLCARIHARSLSLTDGGKPHAS